MISTEILRTLDLHTPLSDGRHAHFSAASGLVVRGEKFYVIADDEVHLACFTLDSKTPGCGVLLFADHLPDGKKARKAAKPDLETLGMLMPSAHYKHGALLALGSGSKPNRQTGVLVPFLEEGNSLGPPQILDLSLLYDALRERFSSLNIEGLALTQETITLLQRGNASDSSNALIALSLTDFLAITTGKVSSIPAAKLDIHTVDLGCLEKVPLGFTDGIVLADGNILFSAAAEDTQDTYSDGHCAGSVIGVVTTGGVILRMKRLDRACKVEGIATRMENGKGVLLMVTDADDEKVPALLLKTDLFNLTLRCEGATPDLQS